MRFLVAKWLWGGSLVPGQQAQTLARRTSLGLRLAFARSRAAHIAPKNNVCPELARFLVAAGALEQRFGSFALYFRIPSAASRLILRYFFFVYSCFFHVKHRSEIQILEALGDARQNCYTFEEASVFALVAIPADAVCPPRPFTVTEHAKKAQAPVV